MAPQGKKVNGVSKKANTALKNDHSDSSIEKDVRSISKSVGEDTIKVDQILKYTPISEIPGNVNKLRKSFIETQKTHSLQFRLNQLRNLYFVIKDNVDPLCEALEKDFYRSPEESKFMEIFVGLNELIHTMANLHKWAKRTPVEGLPVALKTSPVYVERIPLGVVLVISPFNYPFLLSFASIVGAIAGGNAVVFKPSEATPHFSQLLCELTAKALDDDIFYYVNGGVPETTALLEEKYDKIMYTGNNVVGKIIAKKAAETLTPVILELGGKSPAFVLDDVRDSDIKPIANRIVWGRFSNAGQTCVAVDYLLVHEKVKDKLVKEIVNVIKNDFFPTLNSDTKLYTHIIHSRAYNNLKNLVAQSKGKPIVKGEVNDETRFFAPTVLDEIDWDDSTMQQEIFGPILPIITYSDLNEALQNVIKYHDTPLAQYIFTGGSKSRKKNPQIDKILRTVRSGDAIVNDVLMHASLADAPFGGIGESGYGAYHGVYSYRAFTHERTIMEQDLWNDFAMKARYPPYNDNKIDLMETTMAGYNGKVWFSRDGNVRVGGPSILFSAWNGAAGIANLIYRFARG